MDREEENEVSLLDLLVVVAENPKLARLRAALGWKG